MEGPERTCCFTGHRPEKIADPDFVKARLRETILSALKDGYTDFISGMARGVDLWAAEAVLSLRGEGRPVRLICAYPFPGHSAESLPVSEKADEVYDICPTFFKAGFHLRNRWMVDRSGAVIAVFNGSRGGTKLTVDYALSLGRRFYWISPEKRTAGPK